MTASTSASTRMATPAVGPRPVLEVLEEVGIHDGLPPPAARSLVVQSEASAELLDVERLTLAAGGAVARLSEAPGVFR